MAGSILGNRVQRTEDPALLSRGGIYVGDLGIEGAAHVYFVRSIEAHARLVSIDTADAAAAPGVVAVFTNDDLGVAAHHGFVKVGDAFVRPPLADGVVRFVGEPLAMVVAESLAEAIDAAELVVVDYEPLPVVVDPELAMEPDAEVVFATHGSNVALSAADPETDVLAGADHVVRGRYVNQRVAPVPLEPNSAAAVPGGWNGSDDSRLTFYAANQMPHMVRGQLAKALGIPADEIHLITPDVGGGFGAKAGLCQENTALAAAAMKLDRALTWTEVRSDDMVGLVHSRAQIQYCELGCSADGVFGGLRVRLVGDAGAYPNIGALLPAGTKRMSNATYTFDAIRFDLAVGVTNTTPTGAYRGAGRPEATSLVERLVDQAALELGIDPLEIRRRNFIAAEEFPFKTLTGVTYDCGDYAATLERAAELAGYEGLRAEQAERRARGDRTMLGIGVASYVEVTSGGGGSEYASVDINADGSATIKAGTSAHGQGHQTSYAMLVSNATGIPVDRITLVQSDTDLVPTGGGTGGSRSLQLAGSAVTGATDEVVGQARLLAAQLLEANVDDVVVNPETGTVGVVGVPATALSWGELAAAAEKDDEPLTAEFTFNQDDGTFPFGTHISVVEVDLDTGRVTPLRHVGVDDAGTVINELIFEGQQQGGIAQGMSQALYEEVGFSPEGTPLTTNLMDYAFPSAAEFCSFETHHTVTPTPLNPLGAKGIGEAATIGSTPAVQNAVIDAVSHLGVRHIDMPCTSQRVWEAIRAAEAGNPPDPWREPPAVFERLHDANEDEAAAAADAAESI